MNLSKAMAASFLCLALVGCDDRDGTLVANKDLVLKTKHGQQIVPAGSYAADIEGKSSTEVLLEIQTSDDKTVANFKVPKDALNQSTIFVAAAQTGQAYDVAGTREVDSQTSQPVWGVRGCTYTAYEYRCWQVKNPPVCHVESHCNQNGCSNQQVCHDGGYHTECGNIAVQRPGQQEYYYTTTQTEDDLTVKLQDPGTQNVAATFSSVIYGSHSNIISAGVCR